jgi:hypothetical protein
MKALQKLQSYGQPIEVGTVGIWYQRRLASDW